MHDFSYRLGFGNSRCFQTNSYGRGGSGNDCALKQDGSAPTMPTSPRHQMARDHACSSISSLLRVLTATVQSTAMSFMSSHGISNRLISNGSTH
jgi:hypothetical protein